MAWRVDMEGRVAAGDGAGRKVRAERSYRRRASQIPLMGLSVQRVSGRDVPCCRWPRQLVADAVAARVSQPAVQTPMRLKRKQKRLPSRAGVFEIRGGQAKSSFRTTACRPRRTRKPASSRPPAVNSAQLAGSGTGVTQPSGRYTQTLP